MAEKFKKKKKRNKKEQGLNEAVFLEHVLFLWIIQFIPINTFNILLSVLKCLSVSDLGNSIHISHDGFFYQLILKAIHWFSFSIDYILKFYLPLAMCSFPYSDSPKFLAALQFV